MSFENSTPASQMKSRWQEVRNLVADNKRDLPADIYGPYFNDHFDDVYGNVYAITSDSFSYEEMRRVASKIKDMFVQVPDVKKSSSWACSLKNLSSGRQHETGPARPECRRPGPGHRSRNVRHPGPHEAR